MPWKIAGVEAVLVIWKGSVAVLVSWTEPKFKLMGEMAIGDGVAVPRRLMKSRAELAVEVISMALMRVEGAAAPLEAGVVDWGVKVTVRRQLAPGRMAAQVLWMVKSGLVWRALI